MVECAIPAERDTSAMFSSEPARTARPRRPRFDHHRVPLKLAHRSQAQQRHGGLLLQALGQWLADAVFIIAI